MKKMIEELRDLEDSIGLQIKQRFDDLFKGGLKPNLFQICQRVSLSTAADLKAIKNNRGFYIILTDRDVGENACTFQDGPLRAIYRGHADKVFDRLSSHLDYTAYVKRTKLPWDQCLKVKGGQRPQGGIDFHDSIFCESKWSVMVLPLPGSTAFIRKHAEYAFDDAFNKPIASQGERSKRRF